MNHHADLYNTPVIENTSNCSNVMLQSMEGQEEFATPYLQIMQIHDLLFYLTYSQHKQAKNKIQYCAKVLRHVHL